MKKLVISLLVLALCLAMTACTSADPTTAPSSSAEANVTDPTTAPTQPTESTKPTPTLPAGTKPPETEPTTTAPTTTASTYPQIAENLVLGSTMPDFTLTDVYGESFTLYELLAEKQMVMLNFWFIDCYYCKLEFPHINEAYIQYQDQIEILAISPYDSVAGMKTCRYTNELEFPVFQDQVGLAKAFSVTGYPTTVIIDRYGVVCLVQIGAVPEVDTFLNVFAYFTAEEYETQLFKNIWEIKG